MLLEATESSCRLVRVERVAGRGPSILLEAGGCGMGVLVYGCIGAKGGVRYGCISAWGKRH